MRAPNPIGRWLLLILLTQAACATVPDGVPKNQHHRYRRLRAAIDKRRTFDFHSWARTYHGGLCSAKAAAELGLTVADVPLLERLGSGDEKVAFGAAEMLASLGPAGRDALIRLMRRNDDVGARFRDGYGVDLDRGKVGYYETCRTQEP